MAKKLISICIPVFNEGKNIYLIYWQIKKILARLSYDYEIIFTDNASADQSSAILDKLAQKDKRVKIIFLSRNFGHEGSAWAGMEHAQGSAIISIECDLQSPPALIPQLIKHWEAGYESVVAIYDKIDDILPMIYLRKAFYAVLKHISQIDIPANATGFGLIDRKVLTALQKMPEKQRFYRGLRAWAGFKTIKIKYSKQKRQNGHSSYRLINYFKHAERGIFAYSYLLLDLLFYGSAGALFLNLFLFFLFLIASLLSGQLNQAIFWALFVLILTNIQILAVGILGKYIEVITEESKARPVYLVRKYVNF